MPVQNQPNEPERANNHPVNQLAKRYLRLEKQDPDPTILYILQLALWALDEGKVKPYPEFVGPVRESLESLLGWEPDQALQYLIENPDDPEFPLLTPRQLRKAMSAEQAARAVLHALDLRMTSDESLDYPPTKYPRH